MDKLASLRETPISNNELDQNRIVVTITDTKLNKYYSIAVANIAKLRNKGITGKTYIYEVMDRAQDEFERAEKSNKNIADSTDDNKYLCSGPTIQQLFPPKIELMTGQEWYDRFIAEIGELPEDRKISVMINKRTALEAAQRAAGLDG